MHRIKDYEMRSGLLVNTIIKKVKYDNSKSPNYAFWALYLDDNKNNPRDVDTCATSYCISILESEKRRCISAGLDESEKYHRIIQLAVRTLLKLRRTDGSWPSVIDPSNLKNSNFESSSDVAICDNYFALTALLDVDFLSSDFQYKNGIPNELLDLNCRIDYIDKTIDWLINNRASDGIGWYYTNKKTETKTASVTLATTNIISILNRIYNALKPNSNASIINHKIKRLIESINKSLIVNINEDGGIDKTIISESTTSSLLHTCKLVDALILYEDVEYLNYIQKAIQYIVITCKDSNILDSIEKNIELYSETYTLALSENSEIAIRHENYIEGVILYTLLNIIIQHNQSTSYISNIKDINLNEIETIIDKTIDKLIKLQKQSGKWNGLFGSRVPRPDGVYPVYASFEGYRAFRMYMEAYKIKVSQEEKVNIEKNIIDNYPFKYDKPYVFISYPHSDYNDILLDVRFLKRKVNCWIDFENIDGGRCSSEDDWTKKIKPILDDSNCKGIIIYISREGFLSNGLLREIEWIQSNNKPFYMFLNGFDKSINPKNMADVICNINTEDNQMYIRRILAFSFITQTTKDDTEYTYYHRDENFKHLNLPDFNNWLKKINL